MKTNGRLLRATVILNYPKVYRGEPVFGDFKLYHSLIDKVEEGFPGTKEALKNVREIPLDKKLPKEIDTALDIYLRSCDGFAKDVIREMNVEDAECKIYSCFDYS